MSLLQKACSSCKIVKPRESFYPQNDRKSGITSKCKECKSQHVSIRWRTDEKFRKRKLKVGKLYRENNPDRYAIYRKRYAPRTLNSRLKKSYGLTLEDYEQLCKDQNNTCPICSKIVARLVVDHAEGTMGQYRGLLCSPCNAAIGIFSHDQKVLERAIKYLIDHAR